MLEVEVIPSVTVPLTLLCILCGHRDTDVGIETTVCAHRTDILQCKYKVALF